ncbi:MAG: hypothetical protein Q8S19_04830, partial [Bacillota bacterium]|nr:hypothetical protein [Bacillota bacterium]
GLSGVLAAFESAAGKVAHGTWHVACNEFPVPSSQCSVAVHGTQYTVHSTLWNRTSYFVLRASHF